MCWISSGGASYRGTRFFGAGLLLSAFVVVSAFVAVSAFAFDEATRVVCPNAGAANTSARATRRDPTYRLKLFDMPSISSAVWIAFEFASYAR